MKLVKKTDDNSSKICKSVGTAWHGKTITFDDGEIIVNGFRITGDKTIIKR